MFVIQTKPTCEEKTKRYLEQENIKSILPKTKRLERRKRKWDEKERLVFPSYLFIDKEELNSKDYYTIKNCDYVIRMLNQDDKVFKLSESEVEFINLIDNLNEVLELEMVKEFDFVEVNNHKMQVVYIDKRQKRAKFRVVIGGISHIITLSYKLKQDELVDKELIHSSLGSSFDIV